MSALKQLGKQFLELVDDAGYGIMKLLQPFGLDRQYQNTVENFSGQVVDAMCKIAFPYKAIDFEKYIPAVGPAVVASSHNSEWDVIMNAATIVNINKRYLWQMAKHSLFKIPVVNAWVRTHFAFPLRRGETDKDSMNFALDLLSKGELVGMFPEGTTNEGNGKLLEPHVGVMRLAIEADVPIIPLGVTGTENIYPKHGKMLNVGKSCVLRCGKPYNKHRQFSHKYPRPDYGTLRELTDDLMNEIKGLLYYNTPI
ncbi:MAG: 1-acyl-sn-glycerol-3-phosphate acyltransferase [Promethearchaeota archaeon CR_4]|nr:MAG: 1-acyl-sn-glycerol-3-phosphate acyltransferase [Candidatus Lokiarchaeota archaeon CR_4]